MLANCGYVITSEQNKTENFVVLIECDHGDSAHLFGSNAFQSLLRSSNGNGSGPIDCDYRANKGGCPFMLEYFRVKK